MSDAPVDIEGMLATLPPRRGGDGGHGCPDCAPSTRCVALEGGAAAEVDDPEGRGAQHRPYSVRRRAWVDHAHHTTVRGGRSSRTTVSTSAQTTHPSTATAREPVQRIELHVRDPERA
jgi:hypothetical protein